MRVIIAGSRTAASMVELESAILNSGFEITTVISGGARGVDRLGETWAKVNGILLKVYPADWDTHGKSAGYLRNALMASRADALVALWDGQSHDTRHMIACAKGRGLQSSCGDDVVMGSFDLQRYIAGLFDNVERGPEDMHGYQNTAVNFLLENPYSALFIDLGLGKTCISLTAILNLVSHFEADHILIVAPVRVANETWPTEIGLWRHTAPLTYVHVREEEVVAAVNAAGQAERNLIKKEIEDQCLWDGMTRADTKAAVAEAMKSQKNKARIEKARLLASRKAVREHFRRNPATVHIINREQVEFLVDAWGRDWPYDTVFIDESSSLKDHKTGRFKALKRVRPLIKRMHQLTATPAAETYEHLFAQIYLLDLGERFGKSITRFREEYFSHNTYSHKYTLKAGAEEKIAAKIADICLTMKAEDYLDLEKPAFLYDKVKLSPEQYALSSTIGKRDGRSVTVRCRD